MMITVSHSRHLCRTTGKDPKSGKGCCRGLQADFFQGSAARQQLANLMEWSLLSMHG